MGIRSSHPPHAQYPQLQPPLGRRSKSLRYLTLALLPRQPFPQLQPPPPSRSHLAPFPGRHVYMRLQATRKDPTEAYSGPNISLHLNDHAITPVLPLVRYFIGATS